MDQEAIIQYVADTFPGVEVLRPTDGPGAGDTFFMYGQQKMPFATIVAKNYDGFDEDSRLERPDVFRLNVGVSRESFAKLFGAPPDAASRGHDYAALDRLMPHPVYATQSWACVLNPSPETFEQVKPLLAEAYARAAQRG